MCQVSHVTRQVSCVACHLSHITCHMSTVTSANSHSLLTPPVDWFAKTQKRKQHTTFGHYDLETKSTQRQGSRKRDPWNPVGSDKTNLVGQKEIYTHCRLDTTHSRLRQTPHYRLAKTLFSTVPSNSVWQWTDELRAQWRGVPLSTVSWSCTEQLKKRLFWPVVWRLTFSGVRWMITCRRLHILCRVNTKGKWQIQRRIDILRCIYSTENVQTSAGDHPSNTRECQTPNHRPVKTYFQLFLATPTDSGQWKS